MGGKIVVGKQNLFSRLCRLQEGWYQPVIKFYYSIPANLRFFCHQNHLWIKFNILNHRFKILNFIDMLFRWQKKRKLAGMLFCGLTSDSMTFSIMIKVNAMLLEIIHIHWLSYPLYTQKLSSGRLNDLNGIIIFKC